MQTLCRSILQTPQSAPELVSVVDEATDNNGMQTIFI